MAAKRLPRPSAQTAADLRGAARLATEATTGLTDLVEAMHARIARVPFAPASKAGAAGRTTGLTGFVYRSVRGVARAAGGGVDALLGWLAPALGATAGDPSAPAGERREALLAALNGVLGDHLANSANPLATPMAMRRDGRPLTLEREALRERLPAAGPRVLVLLHGLCMSDRQWRRDGHDHGAALAQALGFTPVYLQYNSGLHVSTNGRALATLLEQLLAAWPVPVQRLVLLGHSMGGLIARSAQHLAAEAGMAWPARLTDIVFLGTPHQGAPLERGGQGIGMLLGALPYAAPLARLARVRSAGITDLRHGNVLDEDWAAHDRFADHHDHRRPLPLPAGVRCFAIGASTGKRGGDIKDRLLGDGLVPLASALGQHRETRRRLDFAPERRYVVYGTSHLALLSSDAVCRKLVEWLRDDCATA